MDTNILYLVWFFFPVAFLVMAVSSRIRTPSPGTGGGFGSQPVSKIGLSEATKAHAIRGMIALGCVITCVVIVEYRIGVPYLLENYSWLTLEIFQLLIFPMVVYFAAMIVMVFSFLKVSKVKRRGGNVVKTTSLAIFVGVSLAGVVFIVPSVDFTGSGKGRTGAGGSRWDFLGKFFDKIGNAKTQRDIGSVKRQQDYIEGDGSGISDLGGIQGDESIERVLREAILNDVNETAPYAYFDNVSGPISSFVATKKETGAQVWTSHSVRAREQIYSRTIYAFQAFFQKTSYMYSQYPQLRGDGEELKWMTSDEFLEFLGSDVGDKEIIVGTREVSGEKLKKDLEQLRSDLDL